MPKARKAKRRQPLIVTYVRVKAEEHAMLVRIAGERGHPHSLTSVAAEMISRGLRAAAEDKARAATVEGPP